MPKVRGLTPEQRRRQKEKEQKERTSLILRNLLNARRVNRRELAADTGMGYDKLCRCIREGEFPSLTDLINVLDALGADEGTRAAIAGGRQRCRHEPGHAEAV